MGDNSKIEWTDATWNPVRGCSVVSEGCRNCYAMAVAARFSGPGMPYEGLAYRNESGAHWTGKVRLIEEHLEDPLRWKAPRRIFVNSMSDLFHEALSDEDVIRVFDVMRRCPRHTFQVLTKRPGRMRDFCSRLRFDGSSAGRMWLAANAGVAEGGYRLMGGNGAAGMPWVWLGVSCEDQNTADERIPVLLETPAAVRWISAEPLLGPVDLNNYLYTRYLEGGARHMYNQIDWVVVGGESGPKARPMHPDWARSLRDQCVAAGVPYFFKQWGEWIGSDQEMPGDPVLSKCDVHHRWSYSKPSGPPHFGMNYSIRVGKKAAGRLLDGRTWDEFPELKAVTA